MAPKRVVGWARGCQQEAQVEVSNSISMRDVMETGTFKAESSLPHTGTQEL